MVKAGAMDPARFSNPLPVSVSVSDSELKSIRHIRETGPQPVAHVHVFLSVCVSVVSTWIT